MKKFMILCLVLLHCFLLGACGGTAGLSGPQNVGGQAGTGKTPGTANGSVSYAEPEIVIHEDEVEWEELRDVDNRLWGYVKHIYGTNNQKEGVVLMELYDRNKNLLHSFSPKLPGGTMGLGIAGDVIFISDWNDYGSTDYSFNISDLSHPLAYSEYRNGATTRLDLYGNDGQVVRTLAPSDPVNKLDWQVYDNGVFMVDEHYSVSLGGGWALTTPVRKMYYTEAGDLLLENWYTIEMIGEDDFMITRIESKDEAGNVLAVYDRTAENCTLHEYYNPDRNIFWVQEECGNTGILFSWDPKLYFQEYRDLQTKENILSVRHIYQGDQFDHTEMTAYGGKVEVVDCSSAGNYSKLEFYDPDGNLQATFEAPEKRGWMTVTATVKGLRIEFYDAAGANVSTELYHPDSTE